MLSANIIAMTMSRRGTPLTAEDIGLPAEETTSCVGDNRPRRRTLHLIDADNLIGDPCTTDRTRIRAALEGYRRASGYDRGDHVVVATGCNGLHVLEIRLAWPEAQHRCRRGRDGADLELLDAAELAASSGRYDRVVIGSGDRVFMVAVQNLFAASIDVEIVTSHRRLAPALAALAHGRIRYMASQHEPALTVRPAA